MITLLAKGSYRLTGSRGAQKILYLGDQGYVWTYAQGIGEILSFSKHQHKTHYVLAVGAYKIFDVADDQDYVDLQHLELSLGRGLWQGYLLLTGLPTSKKIRSRIVPTSEVIRASRKRSVST